MTITNTTHDYSCHVCGKRAKAHAEWPDGVCGNVCGSHRNMAQRQGGTTTESTRAWCADHGDHAEGGSVTTFDLRYGSKVTRCHPCHKAARA